MIYIVLLLKKRNCPRGKKKKKQKELLNTNEKTQMCEIEKRRVIQEGAVNSF